MSEALSLITFLSAIVVLTVVAKRVRIPYPIAFVIGGVILAFMRRLPHPHVDPDIILLLILPPLLYGAAWTTDWVLLKRNWRPVSLLAVGLVVATMGAVAVVVHLVVPGFDWPLAFTLGAIVSPPDAVAAEAVFERLAIPRRVVSIVSGESLLNDATALVAYRFALAALVSGAFSLARASVEFVIVAVGGIVIGVIAAIATEAVLRYIAKHGFDDASLASVVFLLTPFVAYASAEALHVSGVLAAVSAGLVLGQRSALFIDSETRLVGSSVWRLLTFLLNGLAFLLIGLQLPLIVAELGHKLWQYALYGLLISVVAILIRFAWVFPATYLPRLLDRKLAQRDPTPRWQSVVVVGWAGMRGIVSLAVALALPYTLGEQPFPERSETIFLTFCVIFVTLVGQGLSLGPLVEWLGVTETSKNLRQESKVRIVALEAGLARVRELQDERHDNAFDVEVTGRILDEYQRRIEVLRGRAKPGASDDDKEIRADRHFQKEALAAERRKIMELRHSGDIPDDMFRSIEYDLDLAAVRLG